MKLSLAILKNFAVIGLALLAVGATPPLAEDTFSNPNTQVNAPPCWRTTQDYQQHRQWMLQNAPMMGQRGYGRGGWSNRMYDPQTVETLTGEVVSVNSFSSNRGMSQGLHLLLKTDNETVDIHLGPNWYIQNQGLQIQPQDRITVTGSRINYFGESALVAAQVKKGDETLILRDENGIPLWSRWRQN